MDYYSLLGVTPGASKDEIKAAYRKLAMSCHPDRHVNSKLSEKVASAARFKDATEAYQQLLSGNSRSSQHSSSSYNTYTNRPKQDGYYNSYYTRRATGQGSASSTSSSGSARPGGGEGFGPHNSRGHGAFTGDWYTNWHRGGSGGQGGWGAEGASAEWAYRNEHRTQPLFWQLVRFLRHFSINTAICVTLAGLTMAPALVPRTPIRQAVTAPSEPSSRSVRGEKMVQQRLSRPMPTLLGGPASLPNFTPSSQYSASATPTTPSTPSVARPLPVPSPATQLAMELEMKRQETMSAAAKRSGHGVDRQGRSEYFLSKVFVKKEAEGDKGSGDGVGKGVKRAPADISLAELIAADEALENTSAGRGRR
jgi:hypothetical protein